MPFALAREILRQENRANAGLDGWDPDAIPEPDDPDGPPDRELFVNYAVVGGGMTREAAEAEYDRQVARGGHGRPEP